MEQIYLVTGAAGHLGSAVTAALLARGARVRALVLPGEPHPPAGAECCTGDVCDPESLRAFFDVPGEKRVIHCAGIVTIAGRIDPHVRAVNVGGTRNVIALCRETGARLLHVSSVHAIPDLPRGAVIREVARFDPAAVVGYYAKTKAEATQLVLDAAADGLDARVVHPSGILGPGDWGRGHLTALVADFCARRLPCAVEGGYDFVDVRDVAAGAVAAADRGRAGECYILANRWYSIRAVLAKLEELTGIRAARFCAPGFLVRAAAPLSERLCAARGRPPLFTGYSVYTLGTNAHFSHEKADRELGYIVRPLRETLADTVAWLREAGRI